MPITYTENIFENRYRDDYADSDNFHRILFNKGKALQARELTQLQTIIQKQIERFGRNIFKEGATVIPGGTTLNDSYEFVKLDETSYTLPTDNSIDEETFLGQTSAVRVKVIEKKAATGSDPATLYVSYTNTLNGTTGTTPIRLTPGEDLVGINTGTVLTVQSTNTGSNPAVGRAVRFSVGKGFYFVNGFFVQAEAQSIILSKYASSVTVEVGFKVTQDIVTVDDDDGLYDNSGVLPNTTAAGADRYRIRLVLTTRDDVDSDETFVYLAKIRNSEVLEAATGFDQYNKINELLALRTKEESGNYLVRPFKMSYDSDDSDGSILKLKVSEGTAYVNGYRAHRDIQTVLDVNRARDTLTIENEVVAADYGNYVVVENLLGIPNFALNDELNLRDDATYASGSTIGSARVRAVDANSDGTYKIYLFKIEMNTGYYIRDIRSIGKSTTDNGQLVLENGVAVLKEADKNSLLFKLPQGRPSNITDISFQVQRKFLATTDSAGEVGLSLSAIGETFSNTSDWIVAVDSSGEIVTPTITGAGTTSATITGAPHGSQLEFLAYVNKGQASHRTKTKEETTALKAITTSGGLSYVDLGVVDVTGYEYIRADSANGPDIAYKFNLDGGQTDAYYGIGRLVLKSGQSVSGNVAYKIDHFLHSVSGDFFNVNSYSSIPYADIPPHTLKDGTVIDLRDYIDFRPTINSAGTFTGSTARVNELLKPTDLITADVTYYLPRYDKIIINEQGIISVLEGVSSLEPKFKEVPENSLELYRVKMNPYTDTESDMSFQFVETKGYTMADIGKIEKRVDELEELTALNLLELDTNSLEVLDSAGNNRTKSGFLVDNFVDHYHSLTGNSEYRASINPQTKSLHPAFVEKNVGLVYDSDNSTNTIIKGDNVYIKYDEESYILQDQVSRTENVNPFAAIQFNGTVELSPSSDEWRDTKQAADRVIQGGTRLDTRQELLREAIKWNWNGVDKNTGTTVNRVVTSETIRQVVDDRIIDVAVIPFMRSRKVYFTAYGLRPNTRMIPFFDEVDVSDWCRSESFQRVNSSRTEYGNTQNRATAHPAGSTNLTSDAQGRLTGSFFIPNTASRRFRTGAREFTLLDITAYSPDDSTTIATAVYSAEGSLSTRQRTIVSTRRPQPPRPPARPRPRRTDPLAQSFYVHEDDGLFVTKVRLYFSTKSDTMPVWIQIRPMVNGSPSSDEVIPGSNKILNPSQVSTSSDASVATDFEFDEPIFLNPNTEYAIIVLADTTDYNVFISRMGDFILGSTAKRITKQPFLGSFFKSQNAATWTPAQDEDLMFELFRADFDTSTDAEAYLTNNDLPNALLDENPITTASGSAEIKVAHRDHGFTVGDEVTISGVTGTIGGLAASVFNATHTITKVDGFGYAFDHSSNATSTQVGGGTAVLANENVMFDVLYPYIQTISPDNTGLLFNGKFHSGKSFAGTETPYLEDTLQTTLSNREENYFQRPKVIANTTKETSLGTSTAKIYVDMTTSNSYVSPVLDLQRASLSLVNNRVDKQAATSATGFNVPIDYIAETDANQGSHMSKHVTKPITLVNDAVGLKVLIGANRPSTADFQVYYKTLVDDQDINDIDWELAEQEEAVSSDEDKNIFREYRYLIGGQGGSLNPFNTFQIKIVFRSTNSAKVATIKDLRVIALGV